MLKHVKPRDPGATILDAERGRDLPAEGHPVRWTPYWAMLERRGDVEVSDVEEAAPAEEAAPPKSTGRKATAA